MYFKIPNKKRLNGVSSAYFAETKFSLYVAFAVGALSAYFILVDVRRFSKMFSEEFVVKHLFFACNDDVILLKHRLFLFIKLLRQTFLYQSNP